MYYIWIVSGRHLEPVSHPFKKLVDFTGLPLKMITFQLPLHSAKVFFFRKTVIDGSRAHQNVKLWVPSTALKNSTFFENKWEKRSIAIIFAKRFFHFLKCLWGQWFLQKPTIKSWPSRPRKNRKTKSWLWN